MCKKPVSFQIGSATRRKFPNGKKRFPEKEESGKRLDKRFSSTLKLGEQIIVLILKINLISKRSFSK